VQLQPADVVLMDECSRLLLDTVMTEQSNNPGIADTPPQMPTWSRYSGQPIDVSRRRSISVRNAPTDSSSEDISHLTVDYFLHESTFHTAVVPLNDVTEVFGQAFNFSAAKTKKTASGTEVIHNKHGLPKRKVPILNHVQSRFQFQPGKGIQLYPLRTTDFTSPIATIDDFVYSLEVTGPHGVKFNMNDGLRGNLLSAHRMLSTHEMVFERLVVENQILTESSSLPLDEAEKRALLFESLLRSHRAGLGEAYYLYRVCGTNNCTSSPFQILDRVVQYSLLERIGALLYRLPLNPRFYLRVRGLDTNPNQRRLVRDEFQEYIDHPDTQSRKREHVTRINAARKARRRKAESEASGTSD
jgi:hypothetical protein